MVCRRAPGGRTACLSELRKTNQKVIGNECNHISIGIHCDSQNRIIPSRLCGCHASGIDTQSQSRSQQLGGQRYIHVRRAGGNGY